MVVSFVCDVLLYYVILGEQASYAGKRVPIVYTQRRFLNYKYHKTSDFSYISKPTNSPFSSHHKPPIYKVTDMDGLAYTASSLHPRREYLVS